MNTLVKRIISVVGCMAVVVSSIAAWLYIEVAFDGCCGAPSNYSNNGLQSLAHLGAYLVCGVIIYLLIHWGWGHPDD